MSTLGFDTAASDQTVQASVEHKLRAEARVRSAAGWFIAIAVLSIVNSLLAFTGSTIHFIFGLGFAEVVAIVARNLGPAGTVLTIIINGLLAAFFVLLWHRARNLAKWAFIVGMALYALDGLMFLLFKDYLSLAVHAYALYRIYCGLAPLEELQQIQQQARAASAP